MGRRYEGMPELKKAELIQGRVFMGSPVRADQHGEPDHLIQTWTGEPAVATPGIVFQLVLAAAIVLAFYSTRRSRVAAPAPK